MDLLQEIQEKDKKLMKELKITCKSGVHTIEEWEEIIAKSSNLICQIIDNEILGIVINLKK